MEEPIYTATINDKPLRYFRSPCGNTDPDSYLWEEGCGEPEPEPVARKRPESMFGD